MFQELTDVGKLLYSFHAHQMKGLILNNETQIDAVRKDLRNLLKDIATEEVPFSCPTFEVLAVSCQNHSTVRVQDSVPNKCPAA